VTYWKTQHFKALQKAWYERLEAAGFQDAEILIDGEPMLRSIQTFTQPENIGKEEYFTIVAQYVHEAEFETEIDRVILFRHAEGQPYKSIADELKRMGHKRCLKTISDRIRIHVVKWGIPKYVPKHLKRKIAS